MKRDYSDPGITNYDLACAITWSHVTALRCRPPLCFWTEQLQGVSRELHMSGLAFDLCVRIERFCLSRRRRA